MTTEQEEKFVFLKLYNGEQVMAEKVFENNELITVESPFLIRLIPRLEPQGLVEQITSGPYCQFTEDKSFTFLKKDLLFSKPLHSFMIPVYKKMSLDHDGDQEAIHFRGNQEEEIEEDPDDQLIVMNSNDTLH
jgi:hypothetical protein